MMTDAVPHHGLKRLALALLLCTGVAQAHDTWLTPSERDARSGGSSFEMSTGDRFPRGEVAPDANSLMRNACVSVDGKRQRLQPERTEGASLLLRVRHAPDSAPLACWVEQRTFDLDLEPALVDVYLQEIRAIASVRAHWQELKAAGKPWRETYRKNARIETAHGLNASAGQRAAARKPVGLPLEIVVEGDAALRPDVEHGFVVLLGGKPLAGLPVEFVNDQQALGIWRTSDAQGRVSLRFPFAARWMLRGTRIEPRRSDSTRWDSEFVTLLLEVR